MSLEPKMCRQVPLIKLLIIKAKTKISNSYQDRDTKLIRKNKFNCYISPVLKNKIININ